MDLTFSSMDVSINQYRAGVDTGGRMSQQRTVHQLRSIAKANLAGWSSRLENQLCLTHVAGARGYDQGADWAIPLESDPAFAKICVNPVLPPTINRRLFAGTATSAANLGANDVLKLEDIDRMRALIDNMVFPPQPVRLEGDPGADENPLYVLWVTGTQWHHLQTATGDKDWRSFIAQAHERSQGFNHPLFLGTPGMWNGIVVKKMPRGITFPVGSAVREYQADGTTIANATAAVRTDRAILLGAQALAEVYGKHGKSGHHANWHEELTDHENTLEVSVAFMGGKSKIRFEDMDGVVTDHGVITMDTSAPAVV
jgi:N4-gp56 family major capsid protein